MRKSKIGRSLRRSICAYENIDERTFDRWGEGLPIRERSRERIEAAIVDLGLTHLLAQPLADPDTAEDLDR